ncbi:hypothetical protein [Rheinheimera sp. F8]|uniref:hypothetical protein n=1 Tax=Rheinheimera sp. F8 TaxID=1763998 RepID=UPI000A4DE5BD|nr:hypothetical protein [Rheinheimera sp. F8]
MSTHSQGSHQLFGSTVKPIQVELSKLKLTSRIPASIRDAVVQPTTCQIRMSDNCPELIGFEAIRCPPIVTKLTSRSHHYDVIGNIHTFNLLRSKLHSETSITVMYTKANANTVKELIRLEVLTNRIIPNSLPTTEIFRLLHALFPNEDGQNKHLLKRPSFRNLFPQICTQHQLALALSVANIQVSQLVESQELE